MVKWGSTLNTCVHAYETKTNLFMEDFQLKTFKYCVYCIYHAPLCIKIKLLIIVLVKVSARFGFLRRNRFFHQPDFSVTILSVTPRKKIGLIWKFLSVILICLRNYSYTWNFRFEPRKCLEKKFVFTDCSVLTDSAFSFAFSILLFSV